MKNSIFLILAIIFCINFLNAQEVKQQTTREIEVTGSAELEVEPDEIIFIIGIEEYWKEEFKKGTDFDDYRNKIPIKTIENDLMKKLTEIGIKNEDITISEVGNYWRYHGKEFLISKQFKIRIIDFSKINEIVNIIDTKGIDYMRIGEIKNNKITDYRKQVKIEALKAAKDKAEYLLASIDKKLGDVISLEELSGEKQFWYPQSSISNTIMSSPQSADGMDNVRKIKLRYEIKAKFEIK